MRAEIGDRLTAVVLYGSVARGEAHRWSEVDLFVVHRGDRETVSEAFLHAKLRLRDQPLAGELTARGVPTVPVAVYRSEEELVGAGRLSSADAGMTAAGAGRGVMVFSE